MSQSDMWHRVHGFCESHALQCPILMAPMAGASPVALAAAVADAGGMGGCGALLMDPDSIADWAAAFRARSNGAFQVNLWVPDPAPVRDAAQEAAMADFLSGWGPRPDPVGDGPLLQDFNAQFEALLASGVPVISTIMGLLAPDQVGRLKARGLRWFATVTTVAEARDAVAAGADAVIAQGAEAGGIAAPSTQAGRCGTRWAAWR